MKKFSDFVCKNNKMIVIIAAILLIPSLIGISKTKINYDILIYLPEDIETIKGQNILTDDFNLGAFSVTIIDNMHPKDILKLEEKIKKIDGVGKVLSVNDLVGTNIPIDILPSEVRNKIYKDNSTLMIVTYDGSTSSSITLDAIKQMRKITDYSVKIGGMSAVVLDTMEISNSEVIIYVIIAVILCLIVLLLSLDSYVVPIILLGNIGLAILYNMGTNIFLGEISYITKAISSVLQLGVTTDFSIFLYHKYEKAKKEHKDNNVAMSEAIKATLVSVIGSSLTTIAGFLALCTMNLTLGKDIGIVMAKGVVFGVICVITVFPALLLLFDKIIEKTTHKVIIPEFKIIKNFVLKHYKIIFVIFLILYVPAFLGNKKTEVYYNLDKSLPDNLGSSIASKELKEKFNIVSSSAILISNEVKNNDINEMIEKIENIDGIDFVLSKSKLADMGLNEAVLDEDLIKIFKSDKYQLLLINSTYDVATNELNSQISEISDIVKNYDKNAIIAGEGPLMKDMVQISDQDFKNVNYSSIIVIFIIMILVLKSISLPIILVFTIEFAIMLNMAIPYYLDTTIPFIASIVIGTIQLGATIDYAILLTTKYIEERKNKVERNKAMKISLDSSVGSIFVSGMCFFAATIGVGLLSKLEMISSLCTLISRGAIISMLTVIIILPTLLMIFDKIILKTTLGFGRKKMKNKVFTILLIISLFVNLPAYALTKEETVYANLNNDGTVKNITVNEHLINSEDKIKDVTNLNDIFNLNGNEKFKQDGSNLIWDAKGKDIYYQGTTKKELPIKVEMTYKLDNTNMDIKEMLGKKGKVTIEINYTNTDKKEVSVNGKRQFMSTPFVVTATTIISNKNNSNFEVSNGKVISNGTGSIITSISIPGLNESLKIKSLKSLNKTIITYDTKSFELSDIYIAATPKLLEESDLDIFSNLKDLYSMSNKLESNTNKLVNGSKDLYNNLKKYNENYKLFNDGINTLKQGTSLLSNKYLEIDNGINQINTGLAGLKTYKEGLVSLTTNFNELSEKTNVLANLSSSIQNSISATINLLNSNLNDLKTTKTNLESIKLELETSSNNLQNIKSNLESLSIDSTDVQIEINRLNSEITKLNNEINNLNSKITVSSNTLNNLNASSIETKITTLNTSIAALNQGVKTLSTNTKSLQDVIDLLSSGSIALTNGSKEFNKGLVNLDNSVSVIKESSNKLLSGSLALEKGSNTLYSGMKTYNNEAIKKIVNYVNGDLKTYQARIEKLVQLGNNYDTFTMTNKDTKSSTKFVMVIDGLKETKVKENIKTTKKEKTSIFSKIKNLF